MLSPTSGLQCHASSVSKEAGTSLETGWNADLLHELHPELLPRHRGHKPDTHE